MRLQGTNESLRHDRTSPGPAEFVGVDDAADALDSVLDDAERHHAVELVAAGEPHARVATDGDRSGGEVGADLAHPAETLTASEDVLNTASLWTAVVLVSAVLFITIRVPAVGSDSSPEKGQ